MTNYVTIDHTVVVDALEWAKANCPGYITNDFHQDGYNTYDPAKYDFFFAANEAGRKEMLMFALRWQ